MSYIQRPKTDLGTIVIHWLLVVTVIGAAVTGLSIAAADNPDLLIVYVFGIFLPGENIWFVHIGFAIALFSGIIAYFIYISKANLTNRIQIDKARLRALFLGGRAQLQSLNVFLYWFLFLLLAAEISTGLLLFLGFSGSLLQLHLYVTWLLLIFLVLHPLIHWVLGGNAQLTRVFRPVWRLPRQTPELVDVLIERVQRLETGRVDEETDPGEDQERPPRLRAKTVALPFFLAVAAGVAVWPLSTVFEVQTRQTLKLAKIAPELAPPLDGDLGHTAWRSARCTEVVTQHGINFDKGASTVEVRAVHDGTFAYFAFTWTDPTRSLKHLPLVKAKDGWHLTRSASEGNEAQLHEDKFAVLLAPKGQPIIGPGIHLGHRPLSDKPASATGRGYHYIANGSVDVWQWHASQGGMLGWIESGHFGPPLAPSTDQEAHGRYKGGYSKEGSPPYRNNYDALLSGDRYPLVKPRRLPRTAAGYFSADALDPEGSDAEQTHFWLRIEDSEPYSETLDAVIPIGVAIPSVIMATDQVAPADSSGVLGAAHWAGGRWTLVVKRRLITGRASDVPIKTGDMMWVAAFDHAETWHTYHVRPLELEVE